MGSDYYGKKENPNLHHNPQLLFQRLHNLERKLEQNPELAEKYRNTIFRGYGRKLTTDETIKRIDITNYIPQHCVTSQSKSDKISVVFSAGAKYHNIYLNNHLLKETDLHNNLVSILLRFHLGEFAVWVI